MIGAVNRLHEPLDAQIERVGGGWQSVLRAWRDSPQGEALVNHVDARVRHGAVVFPADVFRALRETPLASVRVVILGQDPYHGPGQAEGLAFSVPEGVKFPPSLRNLLKEWSRDLGGPMPSSGHLGVWTGRGVLLLNTSLTVEEGSPASHARLGWEALTDALIHACAEAAPDKVFLLWGSHAQAKQSLIDAAGRKHLVLASNHPSPLSATRPPVPFIGCGHFGLAKRFADAHQPGLPPLDWSLPPW